MSTSGFPLVLVGTSGYQQVPVGTSELLMGFPRFSKKVILELILKANLKFDFQYKWLTWAHMELAKFAVNEEVFQKKCI